MLNRRAFIKSLVGGSIISVCSENFISWAINSDLPIRAITQGPKFHWFGYYDKCQFDPSNRYVLSMQVDFEHRSPTEEDVVKLGYIDILNGDQWTEIGETRSWGWQQGCMLQWIPGSKSKVIWNDRRENKFVSIVKDIFSGEETVLSKAIYTVSPDGKWAVGTDFSRIQFYRPGYGYPGVKDAYEDQNAPNKSGIYQIDLRTGKFKKIVSYRDISTILFNGEDISDRWHYFNHLLINPTSDRFLFLHRWREKKNDKRWTTRMFTCDKKGKDLFLLDPTGHTSHFIWKEKDRVTMWTKPEGKEFGFWELEDKTSNSKQIGKGKMTVNGHNTYLPGKNNDWTLNDTYPQGIGRLQVPYLFQESTGNKVELGRFHSPIEYKGEWRCDTHPRSSNDGNLVCIDSPHGGNGRQLYLIDVSSLFS
jgi:hypothetical protein